MAYYLKEDYFTDGSSSSEIHSYLPNDLSYKTELGVNVDEPVPILSGDDNIFSELNFALEEEISYEKASAFIAEFTKVFAKKKNPQRTYNKFVQNMDELPDVELDWIYQYFRVIFFFSITDEDYYCITKYDENTGNYESSTGPLKKDSYKMVAEKVMQQVG